ncbi:MAG: AAA family ATPase [Candidatus Brocadiaceae bacterium]
MSILVKTVRIFGFRGLQNIEVSLEPVTVLTGMNNTGKTSFIKAVQIALGNRQFITQDDFYISDSISPDKIIVDIKIVPVGKDGKICNDFSENWEVLFTEDRIIIDTEGKSFVPLRTIVTYDEIKATYKSKQYILPDWPPFENESHVFWYHAENGKEKPFNYEEVPFFYMDAQRDILEDMKVRNSYLGKMISKIEYSKEDVKKIEQQIKKLNEQAVSSSSILSNIKATLKELDSAMDTSSEGVEITPFTKKIRDLNKGLSIYYSDKKDSFPMEYHGMGTRSWSSLLTLKAFINLLDKNAEKEQTPFFPILAIEEPEAHLHPNAQKKLYSQIEGVKGQKFISTHSPYVAASAELSQIRNFYKDDVSVACGAINTQELTPEDIRRIKRQVINTRGELFFSKAIVFFEGETEEQALPIFAEHYFKKTPVEIGLDFVGVGGYGNYLPFLRVAEALKIPWFILSDGENDTVKSVKKDLERMYNRNIKIDKEPNVFILENEGNFEKYLIDNNYENEIKAAFVKLHSETYLENQIRKKDGTKKDRIKTDAICNKCTQNIYKDILRNYTGDQGFKEALYDCMISQKTQFGPVIAETIIENNKPLPPKITKLFEKIKSLLERRYSNDKKSSIPKATKNR